MPDKGNQKDIRQVNKADKNSDFDNFVLEKSIFSNIFEKDIRRVYIYKKAERLAKAIHLIGPAFRNSPALRNRIDSIAVALVDSATLPPVAAREELSRELLALSSVLSIARAGGLLSPMNAELIAREAHVLLGEIATYEEPRLFIEESPTLTSLFREASSNQGAERKQGVPQARLDPVKDVKGHISDTSKNSRRDAILSVIRSKGPAYIKDISTVIRDVSEKTIQRELASLVAEGVVIRTGDRRWTTYMLAEADS